MNLNSCYYSNVATKHIAAVNQVLRQAHIRTRYSKSRAYVLLGVSLKKQIPFLLYLCQIVDNFYKN